MPAKKESKINLLPQEEFAASTLGRILTWALSSFRIIVIITEMVVIIAFLSRFWLDARASDLNDSIKQKSAIISSMAETEKKFRDAQKRLRIFSSLTSVDKPFSDILNKIASSIPTDVSISSFTVGNGTVQLRAVSSSEQSIAQFIVNLDASGNFDDVSLVSADTDTENKSLLVFTLKLTSKNLETKGGKS